MDFINFMHKVARFYETLTLEELEYFSENGYRPCINDGHISGWEVQE